MADRTERLTISVTGAQDLARLQTAAVAARQELANLKHQMADMKAAQLEINGNNLTQAVVSRALGGRQMHPTTDINTQVAAAQRDQQAQIRSASRRVSQTQSSASALTQENRALQEYINLMAKSTNAADREWAAQQRLNQQRQKGQELSRQLGFPSAGEFGGAAGSGGGNRAVGMAARAVSMGASQLGGMSGIPGAGMAAQALSGAIEGLSVPIIGAIGVGLAGLAVALGVNTLGATLAGYGYTLAGSTALGNAHDAHDQYTQSVLQQGNAFLVPADQNVANAQAMGQIGVSAQDIAGNKQQGIPSALGLAYAVGTNAGMDLGQSAKMVATYMVQQNATVSQASLAFQRYALAADAAGISLQRVFTIMQTQQSLGEDMTAPGQMASLQKQLGLGINPAQLLAPALTATGFGAMGEEAMLGMTAKQFQAAQKNPAQMFDAIAQRAKAAAGGNTQELAGLLGVYGMDTSGMTTDQINNLAAMIQNGKPGQAMAYYNQFVKAGANAPTTSTGTFIGNEAGVRATMVPPIQKGQTAAQYAAMLAMEGYALPSSAPGTPANRLLNAETTMNPSAPVGPENTGNIYGASQLNRLATAGIANQANVAAVAAQLPSSLRRYAADYLAVSKATGVPIIALAAQDMAENPSGDPRAVSKKGAVGIGQIMPENFAQYGLTASTATNPLQNINAQALMDKDLFSQLGSWQAVFAGYNEGAQGYKDKGVGGTEAGYMDKIANALDSLKTLGWNVNIVVTAKDAHGNTLPSTHTIRQGVTTSPTRPPGSHVS